MNFQNQFRKDIIRNRIEILFLWWLFVLFQFFNKNFDVFFAIFLIIGLAFLLVFLIPYLLLHKMWFQTYLVEEKKMLNVQISEVVLLLFMVITILITIFTTFSSNDLELAIIILAFLIIVGFLTVGFDAKFPKVTSNTKFLLLYSVIMFFINMSLFILVTL